MKNNMTLFISVIRYREFYITKTNLLKRMLSRTPCTQAHAHTDTHARTHTRTRTHTDIYTDTFSSHCYVKKFIRLGLILYPNFLCNVIIETNIIAEFKE